MRKANLAAIIVTLTMIMAGPSSAIHIAGDGSDEPELVVDENGHILGELASAATVVGPNGVIVKRQGDVAEDPLQEVQWLPAGTYNPHQHTPGVVELPVEAAPRPLALDDHEEIQFVCPEAGAVPVRPTGDSDLVIYSPPDGCPFKVYDNTHPFGNGQVMVNDNDPRQVAFCALHDPAPPPGYGTHEYSRRVGMSHVTFTSRDQGLTWEDQPIMAAEAPVGSNWYGDQASCTMDSDGAIYAAYLWTSPNGQGENRTYEGRIGLYKGGTTMETGSVRAAYSRGETIDARGNENGMEQVFIMRVNKAFVPNETTENNTQNQPEMTQSETQTESNQTQGSGNQTDGNNTAGNQTASPEENGPGEVGEFAINGTTLPESIVAVWFEHGPDTPNDNGYYGWIDAAWTHTGSDHEWRRLWDDNVIGPCRDSSNPVQADGMVYVACSVAPGYEHRSRARVGDIDIWKIDIHTGETELVETTGILGGHPQMAMNEDGYTVLTAQWLEAPPDEASPPIPHVNLATGWFGARWALIGDMGNMLRGMAGDRPIIDADITALSISRQDKTGLMIYKEAHPPSTADQIADATANGFAIPDFTKMVISFNECDGIIAATEFALGSSVNPYQTDAYTTNPGVFNDFQDGLYWTVDPMTGQELWYFAVNDYGAMQFGAIRAAPASAFCPVPPFIPATPVPIFPQALTIANPASTAVGAAIAAASSAMLLYLLSAKRRAPHAVAAEARK